MKKPQKQKSTVHDININYFLALGFVLIIIGYVINSVFDSVPAIITTVVYLIGMCALLFYMWEIQYRRRTGDEHDEGTPVAAKKKNKKK